MACKHRNRHRHRRHPPPHRSRPGLRQLDVDLPPTVLAQLVRALLARLDDGGALTSLRITLIADGDSSGIDTSVASALLSQFVARSRSLTALHIEHPSHEAGDVHALADGVQQSPVARHSGTE